MVSSDTNSTLWKIFSWWLGCVCTWKICLGRSGASLICSSHTSLLLRRLSKSWLTFKSIGYHFVPDSLFSKVSGFCFDQNPYWDILQDLNLKACVKQRDLFFSKKNCFCLSIIFVCEGFFFHGALMWGRILKVSSEGTIVNVENHHHLWLGRSSFKVAFFLLLPCQMGFVSLSFISYRKESCYLLMQRLFNCSNFVFLRFWICCMKITHFSTIDLSKNCFLLPTSFFQIHFSLLAIIVTSFISFVL